MIIIYRRTQETWHPWNHQLACCPRHWQILLGYFMWIVSLLLFFSVLQDSQTFCQTNHIFLPSLVPTTEKFEIACQGVLDAKPLPVPTNKAASSPAPYPALSLGGGVPFLSLRFHPFFVLIEAILSSSPLFHLLLFLYSILSNSLYIWSISILASLFAFIVKLPKRMSLLLRYCSGHSRLDSLTKISSKWFLLMSPLISILKELLDVFQLSQGLSLAFEIMNSLSSGIPILLA